MRDPNTHANRDPLTGEHGAHLVGVGVGASGGLAAGAALGAFVGGPFGSLLGGAIGALTGGLAGKGAAEALNPTQNDSLEELLVDALRELLGAEGAVHRALPDFVEAVRSPIIRGAFEVQLEESSAQLARVEHCVHLLGITARAMPSKGMAGILLEAGDLIRQREDLDDAPFDVGLLAAAQQVQQFETSAYRIAYRIADRLGHHQVAELLNASFVEGEKMENRLEELMGNTLSGLTVAESSRARAEHADVSA